MEATHRVGQAIDRLLAQAYEMGYRVERDYAPNAPWTYVLWAPDDKRHYTLTLTSKGTLAYATVWTYNSADEWAERTRVCDYTTVRDTLDGMRAYLG